MKKLYTVLTQFSFAILLLLAAASAKAQTTLTAGDIAFTGYVASSNSPQNDAFSFVLLKAVTTGTIIRFTENAWGNDNQFRAGENTVNYTVGGNYQAGVEVHIYGAPGATTITAVLAGSGASAGSVAGTMLSLSVNGDQIIAYQSAVAGTAPFTFISAIHMNVYNGAPDISTTTAATWDNLAAAANNANSSFIPTGLTTGTNAIWIGTQGNLTSERNNARFNCNTAAAGGANLATIAGIRAACNNQTYWDAEFAASGAATTWPLPSGCNFMNVIPVQLISFQAQNNITDILTKWQVTNEIDVKNYEVERSFDNKTFDKVGTIAAINNNSSNINTYSFSDKESVKTNADIIYYRLKTNDKDGKFYYSEIVRIRNKQGASFIIDNLANPVKGRLSFTLSTKTATKADIQLVDASGKIVTNRTLQTVAGVNTINMPETIALTNGIYFLKVTTAEGSTTTRLIK